MLNFCALHSFYYLASCFSDSRLRFHFLLILQISLMKMHGCWLGIKLCVWVWDIRFCHLFLYSFSKKTARTKCLHHSNVALCSSFACRPYSEVNDFPWFHSKWFFLFRWFSEIVNEGHGMKAIFCCSCSVYIKPENDIISPVIVHYGFIQKC